MSAIFPCLTDYRFRTRHSTRILCCLRASVIYLTTRKLCYRKDDRAMCPIHECPEIFRDSLTTPTAIIPNIFHGLLFQSTLWMFLQNLKSVALPAPKIIGVPKTFGHSLDTPTLLFSKILMGFYSDWSCKCSLLAKFEVRSFIRRQTDRQTDRQTHRQTTCDPKTALCTEVHCAVKTKNSKMKGKNE